MKQGTAIIIGAGPAGLTAAIELQRISEIKPILVETGHQAGGISRTIRYKDNRMDLGGHRSSRSRTV
jgi:protoporphyrinogen oxidase